MSKPVVSMSVDTSEFSKQLKKLSSAARDQALLDAVEAGGRVIQAEAMINTNAVFSDKATGALANSIIVETKGSGTKASANVGPTVIYGRIQELSGIIKTVSAKYLHFVIDGVDIFTKTVHIPARPYLRPAVDNNRDKIAAAVGETLKRNITEALK